MKRILFGALAAVSMATMATAQETITSANFEATPAYTDNFAGGAPAFQWGLDPGSIAGAVAPTYVTSTPGSIAASFVAANPLATSSNGAAMVVGSPASLNATLFGLNYVIALNSEAAGTGFNFQDPGFVDSYKIVTRIWTPAQTDLPNATDRFQTGPYIYGIAPTSNLFRPSIAHNAGSGGVAVGTNVRGHVQASITGGAPGSLSAGRWTLMSILVKKRADVDIADVSVGIDADNDGVINEADANEFYPDRTINTVTGSATGYPMNTFGIYTVGIISNDVHPVFVDWVEVYLPATSVSDWTLF